VQFYTEDILISYFNRDFYILPVTSFYVNYNKTHKSRLKYEIKYDLCKIAQKMKKP